MDTMDKPEQISVIVTTHEWPQALRCMLACLARQQDDRFEIIVADDGSGPETAAVIAEFQAQSPVPLKHVWQAHQGFRAAQSRNRAVAASSGDYLIFLDGDCLARPDFLQAHRALAERRWFVAGNRALLSQAFTAQLLKSTGEALAWASRPLAGWFGARLRGNLNRLAPLLPLGKAWRRKGRPQEWRGAKTCNLAVWRDDFLAVDGFDESYVGWGHEDADLAVRLIRSGVLRKDGRFATAVLHLWHAAAARDGLSANENRLAEVLAAQRTRAINGISQAGTDPRATR